MGQIREKSVSMRNELELSSIEDPCPEPSRAFQYR